MIQLLNVCKRYGMRSGAPVLDAVDLEIRAGEIVAVTGSEGCGKTVLLNIVGLIEPPSSGSYRLDGEEVFGRRSAALAELRRRHIAFLFQDAHLIADLPIDRNVALPLCCQNVPRQRRETLVREALELVGLAGRAGSLPEELSGGERRRAAVARTIVNDPRLVLADEPTRHLDEANARDVMDMLFTLSREGAAVLMATQSPSCAARADRVVRLAAGRVVCD